MQFHVGMAHYMLGDEAAARIALQKAADASADFPGKDEARQRLALLAIDVGTANAAARTELENFLRERPNDPAALVRLAQFQMRDGAADQAVKTFEKIVATNPLHRPALRQLALLYGERSTDDPKAYELVQKARQAYPDDADIAKTLGILTYRRQLFAQSAELLEEAARTRKDDAELLYYLGAAHQQLKQWKPCMAALERALNVQPFARNRGKSEASTRRLQRGSHAITVGNSLDTVIHRPAWEVDFVQKMAVDPSDRVEVKSYRIAARGGCLKGFVADHACRYFFAPCGYVDKVIPMECVAGCSGASVAAPGGRTSPSRPIPQAQIRASTSTSHSLSILEAQRTLVGAGLFSSP